MASQESPFVLYYYTYSLNAIMVRFTIEMRGTPRSGRPNMEMQFKLVDIGPDSAEQLSEHYLCNINSKGKVPTLANDKLLSKPMPESVDISWFLCDWYPSLLPSEHETKIRQLVTELHEINYPILTFGTESKYPQKIRQKVEDLLSQPSISNEYRNALLYKAQT